MIGDVGKEPESPDWTVSDRVAGFDKEDNVSDSAASIFILF